MKIKVAEKPYEEVLRLPAPPHKNPRYPNPLLWALVRMLARGDLKATNFRYETVGMDRLGKDEPCLILMNHSSFIDLKIAAKVLYPRPFNIVTTSDGFVGKAWLMRGLGCIPTRKFIQDLGLVRDMTYAFTKLKTSVLLFPEASYSFDGTATPLPTSLGQCIKYHKVPVIMVRTFGAFARDPLYNNLRLRKVDVSARVEYLLSPEEIAEKTPEEVNEILRQAFTFDNFRWQQENRVAITEPFRAEGLNRVLYRCPHCQAEGQMESHDATVSCKACGRGYELTELGALRALEGDPAFTHVPDWYAWERSCVRQELETNRYALDVPVDICMMVNTDCIYRVGSGRLTHTREGFHLTGCDGALDYRQPPQASYSLYSDYFWYELGDIICIGNHKALYYCFPKAGGDIVAKTRLAAEELYKLAAAKRAMA